MLFYGFLIGCLGLGVSSVASEMSYRRRVENGRIVIRKVFVGDVGGQLWQATDLLTPAAVLNAAWMLDLVLDPEDVQARVDGGFFKYIFVSQLAGEDHCFAEFAKVGSGWVLQRAFRRSSQRISEEQRQVLDRVVSALATPFASWEGKWSSDETLRVWTTPSGAVRTVSGPFQAEEVEEVVDVRLPPAPALPAPSPSTEEDLLLDELEAIEAGEGMTILPVEDEIDAIEMTPALREVPLDDEG